LSILNFWEFVPLVPPPWDRKKHQGPLEQQITTSKKLTQPIGKNCKCPLNVFIVQVHLPVDGFTIFFC